MLADDVRYRRLFGLEIHLTPVFVISGITIVGAILAAGAVEGSLGKWLGLAALILATINVVGGYMVTDRMLGMFKKKER